MRFKVDSWTRDLFVLQSLQELWPRLQAFLHWLRWPCLVPDSISTLTVCTPVLASRSNPRRAATRGAVKQWETVTTPNLVAVFFMVAVFDLNTDFFMFANSGSHLPWKSMNTIYLVEIFVFSQRIWNLVEFCNVCAKCRTMWMHWNISGSPDQPDRPLPPRAVKALGPGPRRRHQLRQSLRCPKWDQMGHLPLEASDIQIFAAGPVFIS